MSRHLTAAGLAGLLIALLLVENSRLCKRTKTDARRAFARPSQVILAYTFGMQLFGAIFFATGNVLDSELLRDSEDWRTGSLAFGFGMSWLAVLATNRLSTSSSVSFARFESDVRPATDWRWWPLIGLIATVASITLGSAVLFLFATSCFLFDLHDGRYRRVGYVAPLLVASLLSVPIASDGKRLMVFPIVAAILVLWSRRAISTRSLVVTASAVLALILPLSVLRGYGSFHVEGIGDAVLVTPDYVKSEHFIPAFGNNTEAVSFYFHGNNALDAFLWDEQLVLGETFLNGAFIGSSVYLFEDDLRSSIFVYTTYHDAEFRARGGSYPIALGAEVVMNFGPFALLFFPILLRLLDKAGRVFVFALGRAKGTAAEVVFIYCCMLLARGSSFDLFAFNLIGLGAPLALNHIFSGSPGRSVGADDTAWGWGPTPRAVPE